MLLATWLTYFLGWFAMLASVLLAGILLRHRHYRELPLFFFFVTSVLVTAGIRYAALRTTPAVYFYVYWTTDLAGAPIVFLALCEVFLRRLFVGFYKTRFYRNLFLFIAVVIVSLTVLSASRAPDKSAAFLAASQAFDFMRTALLVFFMGLMLLMGRAWTRYDLGITLGFGLQAAVALINSAVRIRLHYRPPVLDIAEFVAYDIACVIWLITFWKAERPAPVSPDNQISREMVEQARGWESSLKDFFRPKKPKL
jgi:hypothetical protein